MTGEHQGGCFCGALRYAFTGTPSDCGYCHCRMCQRATGAPVSVWVSVPKENFRLLQGEPRYLDSSDIGQRAFCQDCGTEIHFRDKSASKTIDINAATLDDPDAFAPQYHIFTASKVAWLEIADDLPRYPDAGPESS